MDPSFDGSPEMHREHQRFGNDPLNVDDDTVDRLLRGDLSEADAPPAYRAVAHLLGDVKSGQVTLPDESSAVAALIEAAHTPTEQGGRRMFGKIITFKAATIAAGAVFSLGSVAAAATDNLPDPIQGAASDAAHVVGIDLPSPTTSTTLVTTTSTTLVDDDDSTTSTTAVAPGAEACHEAQEVEGAHGCSELAKEHAPGQDDDDDATEDDDDDADETESHNGGSVNSGKGSTSSGSSSSGKGSSDDSDHATTTTTTGSSSSGKGSSGSGKSSDSTTSTTAKVEDGGSSGKSGKSSND